MSNGRAARRRAERESAKAAASSRRAGICDGCGTFSSELTPLDDGDELVYSLIDEDGSSRDVSLGEFMAAVTAGPVPTITIDDEYL